jgi:hypothetical protein
MAFIPLNNQGSIAKNNLNSLALAKDFIRGLLATFVTKPQSSKSVTVEQGKPNYLLNLAFCGYFNNQSKYILVITTLKISPIFSC